MLCQRYEVAIVAGVGYSYCHSFSSCFAVKFRPNPQRRNRHWYWGTVTDKTSSNNRSYHLSLLPYVGRLGSRRTPPRGSDRVRSTGYCKFKKNSTGLCSTATKGGFSAEVWLPTLWDGAPTSDTRRKQRQWVHNHSDLLQSGLL